MATACIAADGSIQLPREVRDELGIGPGDSVDFLVIDGHVEVRVACPYRVAGFRGLFKVRRALDIAEERAAARAAQVSRLVPPDRGANG